MWVAVIVKLLFWLIIRGCGNKCAESRKMFIHGMPKICKKIQDCRCASRACKSRGKINSLVTFLLLACKKIQVLNAFKFYSALVHSSGDDRLLFFEPNPHIGM